MDRSVRAELSQKQQRQHQKQKFDWWQPMSAYIEKYEPMLQKSVRHLHLEFCEVLEDMVRQQDRDLVDRPPVPVRQPPNETEQFRKRFAQPHYRDMVAQVMKGRTFEQPDVPLVSRAHIKRYLRMANRALGERQCGYGSLCVSRKLKRNFQDDRKQAKYLVVLREFLMPEEENQFLLSGRKKLPEEPRFCFLCHIKNVTEFCYHDMSIRRSNPGRCPEQLQTHKVDPREYPAHLFLPQFSPDKVASGITAPFLEFSHANYMWVLNEHEQPVVQEQGMDFREALAGPSHSEAFWAT